MTPAEIAAAPWWRWKAGLTLAGADHAVVLSLQDGSPVVATWVAAPRLHIAPMLAVDPQPDPTDPLLPAWLLHLLRERTGPGTHVHPDVVAGGGWDAWADRAESGGLAMWRCIGSGDTEIDALLAALQGVGS